MDSTLKFKNKGPHQSKAECSEWSGGQGIEEAKYIKSTVFSQYCRHTVEPQKSLFKFSLYLFCFLHMITIVSATNHCIVLAMDLMMKTYDKTNMA